MKPEAVLKIFEKTGALLTGHFLLSSGNHSDRYLQCALVTQYPAYAAKLAEALAKPFAQAKVQAVLGPAIGGIVIAQEVAQALSRAGQRGTRAIFCERVEGQMTLRRGFALAPGERVLAVEDVITTSGSVAEAVALARGAGAMVVGVGCFVDRSQQSLDFAAPFTSLVKIQAALYPPDACPLCRKGIPVKKPGSRGLT